MSKQLCLVVKAAIGVIIVSLWFVVNQLAYEAKQEAKAARAEAEQARVDAIVQLAQSDSRFDQILLTHIEKSKTTPAIEVDSEGRVKWLNEIATRHFDLEIGQSIDRIMVDDFLEIHRQEFAVAMADHQNDYRHPPASIFCQAKTKTGIKSVHVEAWTVSHGAVAYITINEPKKTDSAASKTGENSSKN